MPSARKWESNHQQRNPDGTGQQNPLKGDERGKKEEQEESPKGEKD